MHLIPASTPNETITVEKALGRMVELRIGRTASRSVLLSAAEARRVAQALMAEAQK